MMEYSADEFPFLQCVELAKPTPLGDHQFYWKAEIANNVLTICTWFGDNCGASKGYVVETIAHHACHEKNPCREMWRRAMDKIDRQGFIIVNGN